MENTAADKLSASEPFDRDLFGMPNITNTEVGSAPPNSPNSNAPNGHNRRVRARDLLTRAPQHERRHKEDGDHDAALARAAEPWNWRPFPVVVTECGLQVVDGSVLLAAIVELDPDALVEIEIVDADEALRIRSQNNSARSKREPMAQARRALILSAAGRTYVQIAQELRILGDETLTVARISQLIGAARAEDCYPDLADIITDPARIPVGFWESFARKVKDLAAADEANPMHGAVRLEQFHERVRQLISELKGAQEAISHAECCQRLGLKQPEKARPRARHVGKKHPIPGTDAHLGFAPARAGGAAISLPHTLTQDESKLVFEKVMAEVTSLLASRALVVNS